MTLSEHIRIFKRGLALLWELSPTETVSRLLGAFVAAVTPYVSIWFSARLIDAIAEGKSAGTLALYAGLTVGLAFGLELLSAWLMERRRIGIAEYLNNAELRYARKAMEMSYSSIEDQETALLRERVRMESQVGYNDWYLKDTMEKSVRYVTQIIASVSLTASFFAIGSIALWMKLALVCGVALSLASGVALNTRSARLKEAYIGKVVDVNLSAGKLYEFMDDYSGGKDIRLYTMGEGVIQRELELQRTWALGWGSVQMRVSALAAMGKAPDCALRFAIYLLLIFAALRGEVSVGSIARYVSCVTLLLSAASGLVITVQQAAVNDGYLKRYFSYFDIPNEMYKGSLTVEKRDDNEYFVEFRDVSFKYPHADAWALRHVNLKFKVGEKLAVVGMNGSGKTTFIKLLCRLYDPTEGKILLNGVDIRKYDYDEYISLFSVVFQDFRLFSVSLGQNVAASTDYDQARVEDCLKRAGFDKRKAAMPQGLDTPLYKDFDKDGVEISGGEAQKIALARALYKDAPFIILDEPTAALDPVSEYEVYSRFNAIAGDKTAVYISHRLASCRFCDKIAVFNAGQIVQSGRHEDLIAEPAGKYHELWTAQAQYYTAK